MGAATGGMLLGSCGGGNDTAASGEPVVYVEHEQFDLALTLGEPERVGEAVWSFHFPHFLRPPDSNLIYAYYIDHSGQAENEVGLATTENGVDFTYRGKVLTRGPDWYDLNQASFPAVQIHDGVWNMLYEGLGSDGEFNSVILATSGDGIAWEKHGPVIRPDNNQMAGFEPTAPNPGFLADADVGTPTLFWEDGLWHVYFHMTTQEEWKVRIGYAYGEDLTNLTVSQTPLIDLDADGYGSGTIGARSNIIKRGEWYYMMYEVSTYPESKNYADAWWGSGLARSREPGAGWQKWSGNPVITNFQIAFGFDGPELLELDGRLWLYYRFPGRHPISSTHRVELIGL